MMRALALDGPLRGEHLDWSPGEVSVSVCAHTPRRQETTYYLVRWAVGGHLVLAATCSVTGKPAAADVWELLISPAARACAAESPSQ